MSYQNVSGVFPMFAPAPPGDVGLFSFDPDSGAIRGYSGLSPFVTGDGSQLGAAGFWGYQAATPQASAPLFIRYWYVLRTYFEFEYGSDPSSPSWEALFIESLVGPIFLPVIPELITDPTNGNKFLCLARLTLPGDPTLLPNTGAFTSYATFYAAAGQATPNLYALPLSIVAETQWIYYPAFDGSDTWYNTVTYTKVVAGSPVETYTRTLRGAPEWVAGGFPAGEYEPVAGYTLSSQGATERIWKKRNAVGGYDTVTIELSGSSDPTPDWSAIFFGGPPADLISFRLGQMYFAGPQSGSATALDLIAHVDPDPTTGAWHVTSTPISAHGLAYTMDDSGACSLQVIALSTDYQVYNFTGSIFLGLGLWDAPVSPTSEIVQYLVAQVPD